MKVKYEAKLTFKGKVVASSRDVDKEGGPKGYIELMMEDTGALANIWESVDQGVKAAAAENVEATGTTRNNTKASYTAVATSSNSNAGNVSIEYTYKARATYTLTVPAAPAAAAMDAIAGDVKDDLKDALAQYLEKASGSFKRIAAAAPAGANGTRRKRSGSRNSRRSRNS